MKVREVGQNVARLQLISYIIKTEFICNEIQQTQKFSDGSISSVH